MNEKLQPQQNPPNLSHYKQLPQTKDILQSAFNQDKKYISLGCGKRLNAKPDDLSSYPQIFFTNQDKHRQKLKDAQTQIANTQKLQFQQLKTQTIKNSFQIQQDFHIDSIELNVSKLIARNKIIHKNVRSGQFGTPEKFCGSIKPHSACVQRRPNTPFAGIGSSLSNSGRVNIQ